MSDRTTKEIFAAAARFARVRAGVTQYQLAERTGVDVKTIARIENGITDAMLTTASKIAEALDQSLSEMTKQSERQGFDEGRRVFLSYARTLLQNYIDADDRAAKRSIIDIIVTMKSGIENAEILGWLETAKNRCDDEDEMERMDAIVQLAAESPEMFGAIGSTDLKTRLTEWTIDSETRTMLDNAYLPISFNDRSMINDAAQGAPSHRQRNDFVRNILTEVADRNRQTRSSHTVAWEESIIASAKRRASWLIDAINLAEIK